MLTSFRLSLCLFLVLSLPANADISIFEAARTGNTAKISALINDGQEVDAEDEHGWTPLRTAVENNQTAATKKLLQLGADPNASQGIFDPVILVAAGRNADILRAVIKAGADVSATDFRGRNALIIAAGIPLPPQKPYSLETPWQGKQPDALTNAKLLISHKVKINYVDQNGDTPLRVAINMKNEKLVKFLLSSGADANLSNKYRSLTNLMLAIDTGNLKIIELLLLHGANPNERDETPYHAFTDGRYDSRHGYTALTHAAYQGNSALVKLLLKYNADPSITRTDGKTAIEIARSREHAAIAKLIEDFMKRKKK